MIKKNLCEIIITNLKFLGFNYNFFANNEAILKYFLKRDIITIFGKEDFNIDYNEPNNSEVEIDKISEKNFNKLKFKINSEQYTIVNLNDSLVIANKNNTLAIINYNISDKSYQNTLYNELTKTMEVQRIRIGINTCFDYLKSTVVENGIIEFPTLRMKPIASKKHDIEYFELTTIQKNNNEKSILKRIVDNIFHNMIVGVQTSYKNEDIMNYLENIYNVMENYNNKTKK